MFEYGRKKLNFEVTGEEREVIEYGLKALLRNLISVIIILAIGLYFHYFWESSVLWLLLCFLRRYAGGYHAESFQKCLLVSTSILIVCYVCFISITWSNRVYLIIAIISSYVIFKLAPVDSKNKYLDETEKKTYCERTRYVLAMEEILLILATVFSCKWLIKIITLNFFIVSVSLIVGSWDNKKHLDNRRLL